MFVAGPKRIDVESSGPVECNDTCTFYAFVNQLIGDIVTKIFNVE